MHLKILSVDKYSELLPSFRDRNFAQEPGYVIALAHKHGADVELLCLESDEQVLSICAVRVKKIPLVGGGVALITGGPLVALRSETEDLADKYWRVLALLSQQYAHKRGLVLRVVPPMLAACEQWFTNNAIISGFKVSPRPRFYRTVVLGLSPTMDELRINLNQYWRYELKKSTRYPLQIEEGSDESHFKRMAKIVASLRDRKGDIAVPGLDAEFYLDILRRQQAHQFLKLFLVTHDGEDVAGALLAFGGDVAAYMLGATTTEGLRFRAGFCAHWHAFYQAKCAGALWYDLHGVDPEANPGGYRFKVNTGGTELDGLGPFVYHPKTLRGLLSSGIEELFYALRPLKK